MLVIVWHLLSDSRDYEDLGPDYFSRREEAAARERYLIRRLEALGHKVILEPVS
jgi:hypothetical protein